MKHFIVFFLFSVLLCSCGGTTVKVKQSSDGVNATVTVQTNNPTDVNVKPSIEVNLDDLNSLLKIPTDSLKFDDSGELSFTVSDLVKFDRKRLLNYLEYEKDVSIPIRYYSLL